MTFIYSPSQGRGDGFIVKDEDVALPDETQLMEEFDAEGLVQREGVVFFRLGRQTFPVEVAVEFSRADFEPVERGQWMRVFECPLQIGGGKLSFRCLSRKEFGSIEVDPGIYRVRVHLGRKDARGSHRASLVQIQAGQ